MTTARELTILVRRLHDVCVFVLPMLLIQVDRTALSTIPSAPTPLLRKHYTNQAEDSHIMWIRVPTMVSLFALAGALGSTALADESMSEAIAKRVTSNKSFELEAVIRGGCITPPSASGTIDERLESARAARDCVMRARALALTAAEVQNRAALSELLAPLVNEAEAAADEAQSEVDYMELRWGVGVGYSFGTDDFVDEAVIVDGVVRVTSEKRDQPRALLEFHKFFWCNDARKVGTRGCGPFIAVAASSEDVLSGVGLGFMYGKKTKETDPDGFSIGIGAILDADVKDLGEGFKEGSPPPGTETVVRFEEKARWSAVVFITRTF